MRGKGRDNMRAFGTVTWQSLVCAFREPALLIAVLAAWCLLVLAPMGTVFGFHEQEGLVRDIGLSTVFLGGILVAMVAGTRRESPALTALVLLRPVSPSTYLLGSFAGVGIAAALADGALACSGAVLLRHSGTSSLDRDACALAGGAVACALCFGAWRNWRAGRSFSANALGSLCVGSAVAAALAAVRSPAGAWRTALEEADVLLVQAEALTLCAVLAVACAVWGGSALCGRAAGMAFGAVVVVLGQTKEYLSAAVDVLRAPLAVLAPNFQLVWGGDFFYGDIVTLPWAFVVQGAGALAAWSAGVVLLVSAAFLWGGETGIRATELRRR